MQTSKSIENIASAMNKAQAAMGGATKDSSNPFFKSSYADLGSVIAAMKAEFAANGLSFTQAPEMDGDLVGVTTMVMHTSGEWIKGTLMMPIAKKDPQGVGSAITYARRYALQAIAGIPAVDDDGEAAMLRQKEKGKLIPIPPKEVSAKNQPYPPSQFEKNLPAWLQIISDGKKTPEEIIKMVTSKGDLTDEQIAKIKGAA